MLLAWCAAAVSITGWALASPREAREPQARGQELALTLVGTGPVAQPGDRTLRHGRSQGLSRKSQDFITQRLGEGKNPELSLGSLLGGT